MHRVASQEPRLEICDGASELGGDDLGERLSKIIDDAERSQAGAHLDALLLTGKRIVDAFFGADPHAWRAKGRRSPLYLQIEKHPSLRLSQTKLYLCLRVYELCCDHEFVRASPWLTLSHVVAVLPLATSEQGRLLAAASEERWTIRRLKREVSDASRQPPSTGRPRTPPVLKTLRRTLASEDAFEGADTLVGLAPAAARDLLEVCTRVEHELTVVRRNLEAAASKHGRSRILFVHTSRVYALRVQRELRAHGYSVCLAHSFSDACARFAVDIACVVVDMADGEEGGAKFAREVTSAGRRVPCILISTKDVPEHCTDGQTQVIWKASGLLPLRIALARVLRVAPRQTS